MFNPGFCIGKVAFLILKHCVNECSCGLDFYTMKTKIENPTIKLPDRSPLVLLQSNRINKFVNQKASFQLAKVERKLISPTSNGLCKMSDIQKTIT
ncbi:hypothetical protein CEXT_296401 [Caerostris extrusa]|uniref:Uncharacterized protein n=1 Tax=Caerostris extrusa TaxID=172846 RepID=A0AAV4U9Z7_CAEEX|nr:hypothetical protein CEXT_296401 [Caerostris extrusa]